MYFGLSPSVSYDALNGVKTQQLGNYLQAGGRVIVMGWRREQPQNTMFPNQLFKVQFDSGIELLCRVAWLLLDMCSQQCASQYSAHDAAPCNHPQRCEHHASSNSCSCMSNKGHTICQSIVYEHACSLTQMVTRSCACMCASRMHVLFSCT